MRNIKNNKLPIFNAIENITMECKLFTIVKNVSKTFELNLSSL